MVPTIIFAIFSFWLWAGVDICKHFIPFLKVVIAQCGSRKQKRYLAHEYLLGAATKKLKVSSE
jgi:hypothetical protein